MAEETTEQTTEETTEETTEQTQETLLETPVSPVNADRTFIEGWKQTLPEEIREEKCLDTVTDFDNAIKQLVNHKKMVGKDKITLPNDKSTDEEWTEFYSLVGRPSVAGDYKVDVPEGMEDIFTEERVSTAKDIAYALGATQKQFEAYMANEVKEVTNLIETEEQAAVQARDDAESVLKKEFGGAYDERMQVSNRLVAEAFPNEEDKMNFLEEFGNNSNFIRFASRVGARMAESTALVADLTQKTPSEAQNRIKELEATPGYYALDGKVTDAERANITAEIRGLYKQISDAAAKTAV